MDNASRDLNLEKKIDAYVKGHLTEEEADRLWVELLKNPAYLDLLETELHVKSIIEQQAKQGWETTPAPAAFSGRFWKWTAAAALAIVLATVLYLLQSGEGGGGQPLALSRIDMAEHLAFPDIVRAQSTRLSGADSLLYEGSAAALSGRVDEALPFYNQVIADYDNDEAVAQAYFNRGIIGYNTGRFKDASAAFSSALQETEQNAVLREKAFWFLGHTAIHLDAFGVAREAIWNVYSMNGIYKEQASLLLEELDRKSGDSGSDNNSGQTEKSE